MRNGHGDSPGGSSRTHYYRPLCQLRRPGKEHESEDKSQNAFDQRKNVLNESFLHHYSENVGCYMALFELPFAVPNMYTKWQILPRILHNL